MTRLSDFVDLVRDQILANNGHTTADSDVFAFASPGTDGTYSRPSSRCRKRPVCPHISNTLSTLATLIQKSASMFPSKKEAWYQATSADHPE